MRGGRTGKYSSVDGDVPICMLISRSTSPNSSMHGGLSQLQPTRNNQQINRNSMHERLEEHSSTVRTNNSLDQTTGGGTRKYQGVDGDVPTCLLNRKRPLDEPSQRLHPTTTPTQLRRQKRAQPMLRRPHRWITYRTTTQNLAHHRDQRNVAHTQMSILDNKR